MPSHRAFAEIDLSAIEHNYKYISSLSGGARIIAVVKANAYGHGAVRVAERLEKLGCNIFAVACLDEAVQLRNAGIKSDILILGVTPEEDASVLEQYGIMQAVTDVGYARALSERAHVKVHIKVDTGMSRLGIYCHCANDVSAAADAAQTIADMPNIDVCGIFTHFAESDDIGSEMTERQYKLFVSVTDELARRGVKVGLRHCCNSAAILAFPHMHLDAVRPGIILYGHSPAPDAMTDKNLLPAMKVACRVYSVKQLKCGDRISYGGTFTAPHDMTVAVISIGYADGFSRTLSGSATVSIGGVDCPIVGRICMDLCMVDVSNAKDVRRGDIAVIFDGADSVCRIATQMNTINYEVLCMFRQRVEQIYK